MSPDSTRSSGKEPPPVTAVTVNFKTPQLVKDCVVSVLKFYPGLPYVLIDNGGCKRSLSAVRELKKKYPHVHLIENDRNIGHGPALNQGLKHVSTPYALLLDSDTRAKKPGFIERMLKAFKEDPKLFAIGWLRYVGHNGVATPQQNGSQGKKYIHPSTCMLDVKKFQGLHPFVHSGAPATKLMHSARKKKYHLKYFPVSEYIWHKVAGTRGMFGGECRVKTDAKPGKWRKHRI